MSRLADCAIKWPLLILLGALVSLPGCVTTESRTVDALPPPVFVEPLTDWAALAALPATAPDSEGSQGSPSRSIEEIEAGWRNHDLPERAWNWLVIHHSGGNGGNAAKFDAFHRAPPRYWDELGYHFVIGNGTDSGDGQVEVGSRWIKQKHGAHCATPSHQFNDRGIGICVVGNFQTDDSRPSPRQWAALVALCRFLCRECDIPPERVIGHRDGQSAEGPVTTDCPGRNLDLPALRRAVRGENQ